MKHLSVYILAGGMSRRMGEEKGLMMVDGKPMVVRIADALREISDDITIITPNEKYRDMGLQIAADIIAQKGPAGGIDTALRKARHELVFVTGCDMPFITAASVTLLLKYMYTHEIAVAGDQKMMEPLFAVYRKECKEKWRMLLQEGTLKLSDFFTHFETNFVPPEVFTVTNPHLFTNLNTPQDLLKAAAWMRK